MSEVKTNANQEDKRTPYRVKIEPMEFEADYSGKFITSTDFARLATSFFKAAFVDCKGTTFDVINGSVPYFTVYFNHGKYDDGVCGVVRADSATVGNDIIDRMRGRDTRLREGDRYHISEDGIDLIKPLLIPRLFNNGKPNWKQIVTDYTEAYTTNLYRPQIQPQMTKVIGIDPQKVAKLIWGEKDTDGSFIDYGVSVLADMTIRSGMMPGQQQDSVYALSITKAYQSHIQKTYSKFGIGIIGSRIVE